MKACHGGVGCNAGWGCGVFVVSGKKVRFGVGGKTCQIHLALSPDACAVAWVGHGDHVVGCHAGRTGGVCANAQNSHGGSDRSAP